MGKREMQRKRKREREGRVSRKSEAARARDLVNSRSYSEENVHAIISIKLNTIVLR